jgi:hypothetical protein
MTSKTEVERMQEAREFVSGWLFRSKDRRSSGQSWSLEQCHDAARMLVEFRQSSTVETADDEVWFVVRAGILLNAKPYGSPKPPDGQYVLRHAETSAPRCKHHWSALRANIHECLNDGCGAFMTRAGVVYSPEEPTEVHKHWCAKLAPPVYKPMECNCGAVTPEKASGEPP